MAIDTVTAVAVTLGFLLETKLLVFFFFYLFECDYLLILINPRKPELLYSITISPSPLTTIWNLPFTFCCNLIFIFG